MVFEVVIARRVGAQLRYNGGVELDWIRATYERLTAGGEEPAQEFFDDRGLYEQ